MSRLVIILLHPFSGPSWGAEDNVKLWFLVLTKPVYSLRHLLCVELILPLPISWGCGENTLRFISQSAFSVPGTVWVYTDTDE